MSETPATLERPPATLPLPNALAYAVAVIAIVATIATYFAIASAGLTLAEAAEEYYLQTAVLFAVLGTFILRQRPGHVIGWLLVLIGGLDALTHVNDAYQLFGLGAKAGFPSARLVGTLLDWTWVPSAAGITIGLAQLFPNGHLLSPRWRPLAWYGTTATAFLSILFMIAGDDADAASTQLLNFAFPLFGLATLSSLVPLTVRYRRSRGVERQQLKWVFYGLSLTFPLLVLGTTGVWFGQASAAWALPSVVLLPIVITVAVVRYRLYDIDVVISRTLLVAGLAGFITLAYVAIVVGVGSLVGAGDEPNLVLSVAATAVVAVAFQPVRRGLQRVANRLVYGRRATPYDVLSGFATRVGAAQASPETLAHLAELLAGGTGAAPARVWLRVGAHLRPAATWPPQTQTPAPVDAGDGADPVLPDADLAVPVVERGELLGVLTIAKPRGEPVSEADTDLLARLATASGVVLRNLRLDAELTERLDDLEASRRRLVTAQDDARRRIEADLAGGSRALLHSLRERLSGLLRDVNPDATPKTAKLLSQLVTNTDSALDTLGGLAAGVYPPRLAADGLTAALTEQATKAALPVTVNADGVGRYPPEVEAAVYFAVLEALQNVAKYAEATTAHVRLHQSADQLTFDVTDDGTGFDPATTSLGTGLQGITDRLDTISGTLTINSTPGKGTTITGQAPAGGPRGAAVAAEPELTGATR